MMSWFTRLWRSMFSAMDQITCEDSFPVNQLHNSISCEDSSPVNHLESIICEDSSPVNQLSDDLLRKIFENLCIGDRVRMRLVSKSWRRILTNDDIPLAPEAPWLILSDDSYMNPEYFLWEVCFKSPSEDRIYRFNLPENIDNKDGFWCCCGSSRGWLLIAVGNNLYKTDIYLWNPVSGDSKKLPPLSTLPFFNQFVDEAIQADIDNLSIFIPHVQVFSIGTLECVVAIVFSSPACLVDQQHQLVLCTPDDQSWTTVGGGENKQHYKDILFHNGKLYASCRLEEEQQHFQVLNQDKVIRNCMYSVHLREGCDVEVDMLWFVYRDVVHVPNEELLPIGINIRERYRITEHLVESCSTGKLLVVSAILDLCSYNSGNDEDVAPVNTFYCFQTRHFEVRRVIDNDCLEQVIDGNIGDQCIFIGENYSFSLPAGDEVEANRIYFATDEAMGMIGINIAWDGFNLPDSEYILREQGIFNMQENKILITSLKNLSFDSGSITGWFTPKLF